MLVERSARGELRNRSLLGSVLLRVRLDAVEGIHVCLTPNPVLFVEVGFGERLRGGIGVAFCGFRVEWAAADVFRELFLGFDLAFLLVAQRPGFLQVGMTLRRESLAARLRML